MLNHQTMSTPERLLLLPPLLYRVSFDNLLFKECSSDMILMGFRWLKQLLCTSLDSRSIPTAWPECLTSALNPRMRHGKPIIIIVLKSSPTHMPLAQVQKSCYICKHNATLSLSAVVALCSHTETGISFDPQRYAFWQTSFSYKPQVCQAAPPPFLLTRGESIFI